MLPSICVINFFFSNPMKPILYFFFALLLATSFLSACSDDKKADPQPQNGTVQGQITPATAITTVTATDSLNRSVTATPTATGAYTLSLPKGLHTLRFTPAPGYTAPVDQLISVSAGGITIPDPTNVTQSGGTASLTVNGTPVSVLLVRAEYSFGDLTLTLLGGSGQQVRMRVSPYDGASSTGTFLGFSNARLSYTDASGAEWQLPDNGAPTGSYAVTSTGTSPVRVSGSFSCTLQPAPGNPTSGMRTVAGTFTNVAY
jgi:hypothetical protein